MDLSRNFQLITVFGRSNRRLPEHKMVEFTGNLEPLPLQEQTRHVPSVYLRRNERGNLKREKALRLLGDTPQFDSQSMAVTQGNDDFGQIHATLPGTERHMQFALRFMF